MNTCPHLHIFVEDIFVVSPPTYATFYRMFLPFPCHQNSSDFSFQTCYQINNGLAFRWSKVTMLYELLAKRWAPCRGGATWAWWQNAVTIMYTRQSQVDIKNNATISFLRLPGNTYISIHTGLCSFQFTVYFCSLILYIFVSHFFPIFILPWIHLILIWGDKFMCNMAWHVNSQACCWFTHYVHNYLPIYHPSGNHPTTTNGIDLLFWKLPKSYNTTTV